MFGNPETTHRRAGAEVLRLDPHRRPPHAARSRKAKSSIGNRTRARVVKNKIAPPFRDAEFDIMFDRGISYEGDLLDLAALCNIVEKSGAWYNYKTTRLGQGRENAKQFLSENKDLADEIRQAVLLSKGLLADKDAKDLPAEPAEELADAKA